MLQSNIAVKKTYAVINILKPDGILVQQQQEVFQFV